MVLTDVVHDSRITSQCNIFHRGCSQSRWYQGAWSSNYHLSSADFSPSDFLRKKYHPKSAGGRGDQNLQDDIISFENSPLDNTENRPMQIFTYFKILKTEEKHIFWKSINKIFIILSWSCFSIYKRSNSMIFPHSTPQYTIAF